MSDTETIERWPHFKLMGDHIGSSCDYLETDDRHIFRVYVGK